MAVHRPSFGVACRVLVENAEQLLAKVKSRASQLPPAKWIVTMRGATATGDDVLTWDDFSARG